jgi:AGZA family xanthine/uracil permease-like MFS transporter
MPYQVFSAYGAKYKKRVREVIILSWFENTFKLQENKTDVRTEVLAGLTTFMTMAYIIFVNPGILSNTGMPFGSVMVVTCLASALGSLLMALFANYPFALAPGMGLNAFFAFTVVLGMGVSWQTALAAVFIEGILFIVLTFTKVREEVVNSIPTTLKIGISAGIGLFITFIGLQSAGIIVKNDATLVGLVSLKNNIPALLALLGVILMVFFEVKKVRGGILIGIVIITLLGIPFGITKMPEGVVSMPPSIAPIFMKMDFSAIKTLNFWIIMLTFFYVDFFDTVGTLIGVSSRANMLDDEGKLPRASAALMADAVGTSVGAALGTSTVTTYVESASGVEQGGRTGLTALTVAVLFILAMFFSPIVAIVPSCATAPALIMVGGYMMMGFKDMLFTDWTDFFPALLAFFMMPFAYSIAVGIEFGVISFVALKLLTGKGKDVHWIMYLLALVFILNRLFIQ